jgi:hypothetical protein
MRVHSSVDVRVGGLFLAAAAKECRAARLSDALHHAPTALGWARLSCTAIYGKGVLKVAQGAVSGAIIAQRGATCGDGIIEYIADQRHETFGTAGWPATGCRKAAGLPAWAEFGPVKRLTHIDIAKACDVALIEQKRFKVSGSPLRPGRDVVGVELIAQRLDTHLCKMLAGLECVGWNEIHKAKPPRVIVGNASAAFEVEYDVVVGGALVRLVRELSRALGELIRRFDREPSTHAKMHDQRFAILNFRHEIFRPPAQPRYFPALGTGNKSRGKRKPKVRAALFDTLQTDADHYGLKAAANGFNFG